MVVEASGTANGNVKAIESSTNASPIVVTITSHGFSNSDVIHINEHDNLGALGVHTIANVTANTFELSGTTGTSVGTATGFAGKEVALATVTNSGSMILSADLNALINGEEVELIVKTKVLVGGTVRQYQSASFRHAQADPIKASPPMASQHEAQFALIQKTGVARAFPWEVISV